MKRLLVLLILLLAFPAYGQQCGEQVARLSPAIVGGGVPVAGCSYPSKDVFTTTDGNNGIGKDDTVDTLHVANRWQPGSAYTVRKVIVKLLKTGSPTFDITVSICDDDAALPSATCTTSETTLAAADLTTDAGGLDYPFTFETGKALSASPAYYWIKVSVSALGTSVNYIKWLMNDGTGVNKYARSPDNINWTGGSTSMDQVFTTYSCN